MGAISSDGASPAGFLFATRTRLVVAFAMKNSSSKDVDAKPKFGWLVF
jgi:hypothetical protein